MLANIFTYTLRQRAPGYGIAAAALFAIILMGVGAYDGLGEQMAMMVEKMPAAMLAAMGMKEGADPSTFVLAEMLNLITPLVLCGLAISIGTGSIAGEEAHNTLAVLLGNPKSRVEVLVAKLAAMVVLTVGGAALVGLGVVVTRALFDSSGSLTLVAALVHLVALALFFGTFAALVGALTGIQPVATACAVGLLVVSWLGASMLPLFPDFKELAKALPWHYFSSSHPLHNGIDGAHVGVLLGLAAGCAAGAVFFVGRRDLKFGDGSTLVDQLKRHPMGAKALDKLAGGSLVQNITLRTVSESQTIAMAVAFYTALMAVIVGPLFNSLSDVLKELGDAFPRALMAMIGFADMSTPEGWYIAEVFSLVAPGVVIFAGAYVGVRAVAGEEAAHTMGILLSNPIPRWRVVVEKALAMEVVVAIVAFGIFAGTYGGSLIGDLGISPAKIAAACVHAFALGVFFGAIGLAAGAATGKKNVATYAVVGVALLAWALNAFLPVNPDLATYAKISPMYFYAGNDPLLNGVQWTNLLVLIAGAFAFVGAAVALFERRDLRG